MDVAKPRGSSGTLLNEWSRKLLKEYQFTLSDGWTTYQSATAVAADDAEAKQKAIEWARSVGIPDDAWLHVSTNGYGVSSFEPGAF
jgi:hypothetical protein